MQRRARSLGATGPCGGRIRLAAPRGSRPPARGGWVATAVDRGGHEARAPATVRRRRGYDRRRRGARVRYVIESSQTPAELINTRASARQDHRRARDREAGVRGEKQEGSGVRI